MCPLREIEVIHVFNKNRSTSAKLLWSQSSSHTAKLWTYIFVFLCLLTEINADPPRECHLWWGANYFKWYFEKEEEECFSVSSWIYILSSKEKWNINQFILYAFGVWKENKITIVFFYFICFKNEKWVIKLYTKSLPLSWRGFSHSEPHLCSDISLKREWLPTLTSSWKLFIRGPSPWSSVT